MRLIKTIIKIIAKTAAAFLKPCIVFESIPDFSDNTRCVYDELVKRGYDKKYFFIWFTDTDKIAVLNYCGSKSWTIKKPKRIGQFKYSCSYLFKRKCNISCNSFIPKTINKELSFYLTHGTPIKSVRKYYNIPDDIDYIITSSELSSEISSYEYNIGIEKCVALGYPRNDLLTKPKKEIKTLFDKNYNKIILWFPTYRQHKNGYIKVNESKIPVISNSDEVEKLNAVANQCDILVVIKPHFVQDIKYIDKLNCSNIALIDDDFFFLNNIDKYEFLNSCDALITDYSSVYYDYTICNKPIGLVWEDFDEYCINPGLIDDYKELAKSGVKIYSVDELCSFISDVANEKDELEIERKTICEKMNKNIGCATETVTSFIVEKADL